MKDIHIQVRDEYATVLSVTAIGTSQQGTQVQTNVTTLAIDLTNGNSNGDKTGNIMYETMPENTEIVKQLEPDILKFYYCESEDDYFLGQRVDNFYYARFDVNNTKRFVWCMSRYLPWGEHVVNEKTLWKEHTYPSEPKEISFQDWLMGFIGKYGVYLA